jgi:hypothetical protein
MTMNMFSPLTPTAARRAAVFALFFAGVLAVPPSGHVESLVLKKGDRVAIAGDSITEQKQYSKFMELYLLACVPELELTMFQFGWSGERARSTPCAAS